MVVSENGDYLKETIYFSLFCPDSRKTITPDMAE
jgi:hypothetical protein